MNQFLNKLERKFGKWAVPHLTAVLILCYAIGYILELVNSNLINYMTLEPALILDGQLWRLITWVVIPPSSPGIFTIVMLLFYFSVGTSLERAWGDFRYNVYLLGGILITIVTAFVCYFVFSAIMGGAVSVGSAFSTYYICLSLFLAYAATFPEAQVLLYFIIPVRVKWLGIVYAIFLVLEIAGYVPYILNGQILAWVYILAMAASLVNFVIFFFSTRGQERIRLTPQEKEMRRQFRENVREQQRQKQAAAEAPKARHRCEICGRTELTDPELEFRYCSHCAGAHEYCLDHLYTHTHITEDK